MKTFLLILLIAVSVLEGRAAVPVYGTNTPISAIFYEFFEPHTNARPWHVIKPDAGSPDDHLLVTHPPLDRINEVGTHVDFTVTATNRGAPITYQWYKLTGISNRVAIQGATENVLCIEGVQSSDVAGYEVVLSQAGKPKTNLLANLSVMTLACTASVLGQIESPITAFTGGTSILCDGGTFDKLYSPYNNGKPVLLYGPWVPPIYQVGDGANTTRMPKVTVSTYNPANTSANAPADTAIRLQNNAAAIGWTAQIYDQCNDNISPTLPGDSKAARLFVNPLNTSDNRYLSTYKITIYYRSSSPPSSGKIFWSWKYHSNDVP